VTFRIRIAAAAVLIGLAAALLVLAGRALDAPGPVPPSGDGLGTAPTGTFSPIGTISMARADHSATLLPDGRILVAGGVPMPDARATLQTAGLFDPGTRTLVQTRPMTAAREEHTATLLPDGRVLVAGGHDYRDGTSTIERSAEIYDPALGTFTATGSMSAAREGHTATLLPSGLVLIAGGADTASTALATAELFDPRTGRFSPTGSMSTARDAATATLLATGQVLVAGGSDSPLLSSTLLDSAELYDPGSGTFRVVGPMTSARYAHSATRLADGRVVIIGGHPNMSGPLATAEIYDPKSGTFGTSGSMTTARFGQVATLLADGRVLVVGGDSAVGTGSATYLASAELFDPKTGTFRPAGSMSQARLSPTATLLANGRVLIMGGYLAIAAGGAPGPTAASAELFDPASGTFSPASPITSADLNRNFLAGQLP
jgi:hypothetical protein